MEARNEPVSPRKPCPWRCRREFWAEGAIKAMSPARQNTVAEHDARVKADLQSKPRPAIGWINGYLALWLRPGDVHCLAAGEVTSSVQVQAKAACDEFLKEPG